MHSQDASKNAQKSPSQAFAVWRNEQNALGIPAALINNAEYAQTLRKLITNKYRDADIQKHNSFVAVWGGENVIRESGMNPIDMYKNYLQEQLIQLERDAAAVEEKEGAALALEETFADAHRNTMGLDRSNQIPLGGQLWIKTGDGKTIAVELTPLDTWTSFKEKIAERSGIPAHQQKIIVEGKAANNIRELGNWQDRTIIFVVRMH